ncbi:exosortase E/protease, VPEID-CTERM system [Antarcticimicrobium sediminis]|uniref:Exosortase E/protease, VPEID-CTERM system n=1 Tax=Antarcticimicrobium sediminis TaxID=2546227 RepID=A0A4R5F0A8_9RHOB|nr:exosortase E/protease, VPEID-CTERM system [Antarcticimicrobium sediminis]TDE40824.1 exosortase E/protease, VPEID-CTERM system [Antarcticimicrobium sediminis]
MKNRMIWALVLVAVEVIAVIVVFQVMADFECRQTGLEVACRGLRNMALRGVCVIAGLALVLGLRADLRRALMARVTDRGGGAPWALLHGLGLALIFLPWLGSDAAAHREGFSGFLWLLGGGAALAVLGGLFWLMGPRAWASWLRQGGFTVLAMLVVASLIPDLAEALGFAWAFSALQLSTFYGVAILLTLTGQDVVLGFAPPTIGTGPFQVEVAGSCSGIEGFALIGGFMVIYALLMRGTLRTGRYWLIVLPAALLVSWLFNLLRITVLILIGAHGAPELAVNGFHSFAGWLFFTLLALGVLAVVQGLPALQRTDIGTKTTGSGNRAGAATGDGTSAPPSEIWAAARIVPFIVFMFSGLVVNAFWQTPALGFPVQAALMAGVLWLFRAPLLALTWRLDPVALVAGLLVGIGWIAFAQGETAPLAGLETLAPGAFLAWAVIRVLGTSLLVPVVEEAFFRGYLLARLDTGGPAMRLAAILISSLGFALLHGRILEAGLAGGVFALVMLRRGRLADAILAHATANAAVAAAALLTGDWSLI